MLAAGKAKKPGKRGRKPAKIDLKAKLERSRQSARECRARKKLRYQYLEELVSSKERAICALREELDMEPCSWCAAPRGRRRRTSRCGAPPAGRRRR
uniref:cAMP-responsive element-binding protein-like 2 n=1 Tax=Hippocampus comes TaxID=109280 RepID=A0A3Q2YPT4_HIPCM